MKRFRCIGLAGIILLILLSFDLSFAFEKVKFVVISDPHISIPQQKGVSDGFKLGLKTQMLTENTVAEINKIPDVKFVLLAGDLTQDAEPWNIDALRKILDGLKVPYFVTLGNHDLSLVPHEKKDQPVTLSKYTVAGAFIGKSGGMAPGMTYYASEIAKDLVLVNLDGTRPQVFVPEAGLNDFGGEIDPSQMRWLEAVLKKNQKKTVVVLTHINLVPWSEGDKTNHNSWRWFWMDNADEVKALLRKYGVKAVFSGHRHISTRYQEVDGTFHFVHPSVSTYPMRYTVYEMTPKGLKWDVKDVPAAPEVWELAKKNFLANKWWRGPDHPETPEGNQKYLEFYESPSTMKGEVTFKAAVK
ncbi:MAG: metallophosphoesterase [Syntrophus sp. (in: bacteria)]|nr:metallophosphoesterase [Syntrophus sp. (in: bacteria)]